MAIIIAEAGENHCGNWQMARDLVKVAAAAGADYVKFQLYDAADVAADDPEREWFQRVQVPIARLAELTALARASGIEPLCTPWDAEKAARIFDLGIPDMKIASFHIVDEELLRLVNRRARRVFMSTGMGSLDEVDRAVDLLRNVRELYLLHCVSEYPLPIDRVNLAVMDLLKARYGTRVQVGYSDHTTGILAPVAAVARGAAVVEKHITMDKQLEGTDHILSADPDELRKMVAQIRGVEPMIGAGDKMLTAVEAAHKDFLRNRFRHRQPSVEGDTHGIRH